MQGYFIISRLRGDEVTDAVCSVCVDSQNYSLNGRSTVTVGESFTGTVQCVQCEEVIDGAPISFTVVRGAYEDEVLAWVRNVDIEYGGDTYCIELSYSNDNGYDWEERDSVPDGLRELLDGMDLFDLDEQSAALQ